MYMGVPYIQATRRAVRAERRNARPTSATKVLVSRLAFFFPVTGHAPLDEGFQFIHDYARELADARRANREPAARLRREALTRAESCMAGNQHAPQHTSTPGAIRNRSDRRAEQRM